MAPQTVFAMLVGLMASLGAARAQSAEPYTSESFSRSARWSHYLRRTYGPARSGLLAVETAFDQVLGQPRCWDMSAGSYAQRYARAFDRRLIRNTTELAAGILTGEDLRYRRSGSGAMRGRIWRAVLSGVTARMPDGTKRPAYTRFFANAGAEMATAHWTGQPIRTAWVFQSVAWSALDQIETNMLDEFGPDIRRVAKRLWKAMR